jgi:hypothetical protein
LETYLKLLFALVAPEVSAYAQCWVLIRDIIHAHTPQLLGISNVMISVSPLSVRGSGAVSAAIFCWERASLVEVVGSVDVLCGMFFSVVCVVNNVLDYVFAVC